MFQQSLSVIKEVSLRVCECLYELRYFYLFMWFNPFQSLFILMHTSHLMIMGSPLCPSVFIWHDHTDFEDFLISSCLFFAPDLESAISPKNSGLRP